MRRTQVGGRLVPNGLWSLEGPECHLASRTYSKTHTGDAGQAGGRGPATQATGEARPLSPAKRVLHNFQEPNQTQPSASDRPQCSASSWSLARASSPRHHGTRICRRQLIPVP